MSKRSAQLAAAPDAAPEDSSIAKPHPDGLVLQRVSDIKPEQVNWLWAGRIPRGKLTLLVGDPEAGKTFVSLDFAARVSRGTMWPDGAPAPRGGVILFAVEDGLADTIRPRLDALGADTSRINVVEAVREQGKERGFTLEKDLPALDEAVREEAACLVVIDPLNAYLGKIDSWKDTAVRNVLTPLARMAERTGVAVLAIMHLNKNEERSLLHRVQGSIGFVAVARVVLSAKQQAGGRRVLSVVKNNLASKPPDLAYRITEASLLVWESSSAPHADEPPQATNETEKATQFLREMLAGGPRLVKEVDALASVAAISASALRRAKERLDLRAKREGGFSDGQWTLRLPPEASVGDLPPTSGGKMDNSDKMGTSPPQLVQPAQFVPPGRGNAVDGPTNDDRSAGQSAK